MTKPVLAGVVLMVLLGACVRGAAPPPATSTSTTVPPEEPALYLMLLWHHHQPLYPKDEAGIVTRPWVRVHATKDYHDMATLSEEFPDVRVTFNLTPVLLRQLEELAEGTKDAYWAVTEVPADQLSEEQRAFVLERFFDVNPLVVARFPRYRQLAELRAQDPDAYTDDDFRDLQVLFNLAWTDPGFLAEPPLADLVARGEGFTEEDKAVVLAEHRRIVGEIIPLYARLWEEGRIEVTTSPYAHPILPLIADSDLARVGDPAAVMPPARFSQVFDASAQVQAGLGEAERLLGRRPVGMWPGEGAVAQLVMSLFSREGVQWVATGEPVLAQTLGIGSFSRDARDTVQEADLLYRPWSATLRRNPPVTMFFRDQVLSDLIAFQYSGSGAEAAADDFVGRLERIRDRLEEQGAEGPHVVSVVLDGENAWEHYPNDGKDFLRALYRAISEEDWLATVTPSEWLEAHGEAVEPLPGDVFPASWFQPNFATWIGEEEEAVAWDYLTRVREDLLEAERSGEVHPDLLAEALDAMYLAQGSDWFWWYGADQDSGDDSYFDGAFRDLLAEVYRALGREPPAFLAVPIVGQPQASPDRTPEGLLAVRVDNLIAEADWRTAGFFEGGEVLQRLWWGFDRQHLYVRVDFAEEVLGSQAGWDLYLGLPSGGEMRAVSLGGSVLGFGATDVLRWRTDDPTRACAFSELPPLGEDTPAAECSPAPAGFNGRSVEAAVPLELLPPLEAGDRVPLRLVATDLVRDRELLPGSGPGGIQVPDISDVEVFLEVPDLEGDDHGPGTYVYPQDPVFLPGSYDLVGFQAGTSGDDLVLTLDVASRIENPWGSPNGLSVQIFDVYVDRDPGAGTGARLLIPGRNAVLEEGHGWEHAITVEGWEPAVFVAGPDGALEETRPSFRVAVLGDRGRVILRLPLALLGPGDPAEWGYAVALLSQKGFPSGGVRRVPDVNARAEQYRGGGAPPDVNHTRIFDLLWPEAGVQEELLGSYPPSTGSVGDLGPDDFPRVPLVQAAD